MTRRHAIRDEATAREGAELHDRVRGVGAPAAGAERLDLSRRGGQLFYPLLVLGGDSNVRERRLAKFRQMLLVFGCIGTDFCK